MNDEILEKYLAAGKLAATILKEGAQEIRVGRSYLELVESVEARVKNEGADLAFPLNVSLNEDAAHDTASTGDERTFAKGDVVKFDLGVQIDGYIADTATTVDLGKNALLLEASREALEAAIKLVRSGCYCRRTGRSGRKGDPRQGIPAHCKSHRSRSRPVRGPHGPDDPQHQHPRRHGARRRHGDCH